MLFPRPGNRPHSRRVVVTGAGIVTALGIGWDANAKGFRSGKSGFRPVTLFDASRHRAKVAAEVDLPLSFPPSRLSRRQMARQDRAAGMLFWAAHEAWEQAGWSPSGNLPLVLGTTSGGMSLGERAFREFSGGSPRPRTLPSLVLNYQPQRQALELARAFGFSGSVTIIANACASGSNAIGHAWELIHHGRADRVRVGGYDALSELVFSGFDALQALSVTTCRPFDAERDGLGLGEGAAVLTLESLEHASRRGAPLLGEIAGYAAATDTHHLTQPHPEGSAALASMTGACRVARVAPQDIDYVNAHGTGTVLNDGSEALAINAWAGGEVDRIRVSSSKGAVGHLLGGAGAVEAVVCLMALAGQWLPPMPTLRNPDAACQFPLVREPVDSPLRCVLSNSFGFGGANASLVLRRCA